jgi:hypothetical protein
VIVGMTTREAVSDATHRLVYGELRKGGPKTDPKRPGPDLDHWRFTSERPEVLAAFKAAYGDTPKAVKGYLPYPEMERVWATWRECYNAGGLLFRCDGVHILRRRKADGSYEDGQWECPYCSGAKERTEKDPGCKQVGHLYLVIPELWRAGLIGLVSVATHSINDLVTITARLLDMEQKTHGKLNGIEFVIARVPDTISTPAWSDEDRKAGKRNRTKKYLIDIMPEAEWVMKRLALESHEQMLLAAGVQPEDNGDEEADEGDWFADSPKIATVPEPEPTLKPRPAPVTTSEPAAPRPTVTEELVTLVGASEPLPADLAAIEPIRVKLNQFASRVEPTSAEQQAKIEEMLLALTHGEAVMALDLLGWAFGIAAYTELTQGMYEGLRAWQSPIRNKQGKIELKTQDALQDYDRIAQVIQARAAAVETQDATDAPDGTDQPELF